MRTAFLCLVLAFLVTILSGSFVSAGILAGDSFDLYNAGELLSGQSGGEGWYNPWVVNSAQASEVTIVAKNMDYQSGEISILGGGQAVEYVASEGSVTNSLLSRYTRGAGDTVYLSFLYETNNIMDSEASGPFIQMGLQTSAANPYVSIVDQHAAVGDPPKPRNYCVRGYTGGADSDIFTGVPSLDAQTYLMVLKATKTGSAEHANYDKIELFVNPTSTTEANNDSFLWEGNSGLNLDAQQTNFVLRKAFLEPGNTVYLDEIRIGEEFADVVSDYQDVPDNRLKITTADGNGADAMVHAYSTSPDPANSNWGGRMDVELKNAGVDGGNQLWRKAYMRFDLADLEGQTVSEATLALTVMEPISSADQTFNLYALNDGEVGESWIEGDGVNVNVATDGDTSNDDWITWNNAPANADGNDVDLSKATLLGQFDGGVSNQTLQITSQEITDFVNADSDGLVTFIITRDTHDDNFYGNAHKFITKEGNALRCPALLLDVSEAPGLEGDLDGDGFVGSSDLDIVRGAWGNSVSAGDLAAGDASGDGQVGSADLDIVRANWGNSLAAVPEPGMIVLLLFGTVTLAIRRRPAA